MSSVGFTPFLYAGLDFILDKQGDLYFVEANDHPVALARADKLAASVENGLFNGQGLLTLAKELVSLAGDKPVCLLLPDCFVIDESSHFSPYVDFSDIRDNTGKSQDTLEEFNRLSLAVQTLGHNCVIADLQGLSRMEGKLFIADKELGVLYRRSYHFPDEVSKTPCVNDLRLRSVCSDKLLTSKLIEQHAPDILTIPSFPISESRQLNDRLQATLASGYVIAKPNKGAGSRDVQRHKMEILIQKSVLGSLAEDTIFQPWIEPITYKKNNFEYYVDLRVYLVGGVPVAGFARQAAAPINGATFDSPLSWLTTTGPSLPLYLGDASSKIQGVSITENQKEVLFKQSKVIVSVLENYTKGLSYRSVYGQLNNFSDQLAIKEPLSIISLKSTENACVDAIDFFY